jgi:uncharacterized protein DUF5996
VARAEVRPAEQAFSRGRAEHSGMTPPPEADNAASRAEHWPALPYPAWQDTCETLHMWTQIVGKTRMALTPLVNHWWNVTLYVTARGLTTSLIPGGREPFDVEFDFIAHRLRIRALGGGEDAMPLRPRTVADFYRDYMARLRAFGIEPVFSTTPNEVADPIPFEQDTAHASYDPEAATRFWRLLATVAGVLHEFRARFIGKASPVHFFWGGFDLAVTRFSGRPAPPRPGADLMTREGYSHECSSCGFWPGDPTSREAAFYAYTSPAPAGLEGAAVRPESVFFNPEIGFILRYDDVRRSPSPRQTLLDFCQSTYEAGATLANWPRGQLERRG